jgi:hypothetical protein
MFTHKLDTNVHTEAIYECSFVVFSLSCGNPAGRRNGDKVVGKVHKDVSAAPVPEVIPVLCTEICQFVPISVKSIRTTHGTELMLVRNGAKIC